VGHRVQQTQLIGYVGSTGLATGPHVCFRITKNGKYVNPARVKHLAPPAEPISPALQHVFYTSRDALLSDLDSGPILATTQEAL
jgi:murein DD-endopeptidase MepM/ murein hydrolase activator NlpD